MVHENMIHIDIARFLGNPCNLIQKRLCSGRENWENAGGGGTGGLRLNEYCQRRCCYCCARKHSKIKKRPYKIYNTIQLKDFLYSLVFLPHLNVWWCTLKRSRDLLTLQLVDL